MNQAKNQRKKARGEIAWYWAYYGGPLRDWWEAKRPILLCVLRFGGYLFVFYLISFTSLYRHAVASLAPFDATISGWVLQHLGEPCHTVGPTIFLRNERIITVLPICTAVEFSTFFIAAVLAFPAYWSQRLVGALAGFGSVLVINVIRIISLYIVGIHYTAFIALAHEEVWGLLLNFSALAVMLGWIAWTRSIERMAS